jgi:hypothetical protein
MSEKIQPRVEELAKFSVIFFSGSRQGFSLFLAPWDVEGQDGQVGQVGIWQISGTYFP